MGSFAPNLPAGVLNVALSNYAKEYRNNTLVGDLIAPRVPVARQSFQYVIFDRSNQRLDRNVLRAAGTVPEEDRMSFSAAPYTCKSHALRARIPFEQEEYALGLGFSEKQAATRRLIDKLSLAREAYVASLATNPALSGSTLALSGSNMFDNSASNPVQTFETAKAAVRQAGVEPNIAILSDPVVTALMTNPAITDRFKYAVGGTITMDQLSSLFGIKCVRASAVQLDKNNNASFVWGVNAVVAYAQDATSMQDLSALKTFDWTAAPGTVGGYGVLEFPDPQLDAKADIVSADWFWDTVVTAPETFFPITNCVAAPSMVAVAAPAASY